MSKSPPRLGKGLNALIGPRVGPPFHHRAAAAAGMTSAQPPASQLADNTLRQIPLEQIRPSPRQPRSSLDKTALEQLAASVARSGVLQPILVRAMPDGQFELIAGERRWRAAQLAHLQAIPAIVRELSDAESFETALIENLQREDLGPLERASAYQQLVDTLGVTIDVIAGRLGESRANISNYLRLLKLSENVRQMIANGKLAMGQARAIAGIDNPEHQLAIARLAVRRNLSVRQVEALAKEASERPAASQAAGRRSDAQLSDVAQALSKALGLPVSVHAGKRKNSGRVVIRYNSLDEFDHFAERVGCRSLLE